MPHSRLDVKKELSSSAFDFSDKDGLMLVDDANAIQSENKVTVHNILASATFSFTKPIDLDKCCLALGNSYYNPAEFPALRVDVRGRSQAVYTISVFESGRVQSAGGCRPAEAKKAIMKIGKRLNEKYDYGISLQSFEIQNILAVFDACVRINLSQFVTMYDGAVDYEPDVFPAARVRIPIPKKGQSDNGNESDDDCDVSTSRKLRRLMMGDSDDDDSKESKAVRKLAVGTKSSKSAANSRNGSSSTATSNNVGSYIIGNRNKRPASGRQKGEKQVKEEVVTTNLFSTGKITFTGAKSIGSLNHAIEKLRPYICPRPLPGVCLLAPSLSFQSAAHSMLQPHLSGLDMEVPMPLVSQATGSSSLGSSGGGVMGRLQQLVLEEQRQLEQEHRRRLEQMQLQHRHFVALKPAPALQQHPQFNQQFNHSQLSSL